VPVLNISTLPPASSPPGNWVEGRIADGFEKKTAISYTPHEIYFQTSARTDFAAPAPRREALPPRLVSKYNLAELTSTRPHSGTVLRRDKKNQHRKNAPQTFQETRVKTRFSTIAFFLPLYLDCILLRIWPLGSSSSEGVIPVPVPGAHAKLMNTSAHSAFGGPFAKDEARRAVPRLDLRY
jgi:hypothetical protein